MRRSWSIGLCATLLAGAAGAAATLDDGWRTYRNAKFGYELSYPADMDYAAYVEGASGELQDTRTGHRLVAFEVWPPDECPRQPADATAKAVGIARAKTMTQADGPDGSSACGDPVTVRTYTAQQGAPIYELELTCIRETSPESHDDTDEAEPNTAQSETQPIFTPEGMKGPTYFVDISPPWRKRILVADPVGVDPRMRVTTGTIDLAVLRTILSTVKTFGIPQPPGVCIEDLQHRDVSIGSPSR